MRLPGLRMGGEAAAASYTTTAEQYRSKGRVYGELSPVAVTEKPCPKAGVQTPRGGVVAQITQVLVAGDSCTSRPEAASLQTFAAAAATTVEQVPASPDVAMAACLRPPATPPQYWSYYIEHPEPLLAWQDDVVPATRLKSLSFRGMLDIGRQLDPPVHATSTNSFVRRLCSRGLTYSELPLEVLELLCLKAGIQPPSSGSSSSSALRHLQLARLLVDADQATAYEEEGKATDCAGLEAGATADQAPASPSTPSAQHEETRGGSWQSCVVPEARLRRLGLGGLWELGRHLSPRVHAVTKSSFISRFCSRGLTYGELPKYTLQAMCSKSGLHPPSSSSAEQLAELLVAGDAQLLAALPGCGCGSGTMPAAAASSATAEGNGCAAEEAAMPPATPFLQPAAAIAGSPLQLTELERGLVKAPLSKHSRFRSLF